MQIIDPYTTHKDSRGSLTGIINEGAWEEANYISTKKGEIRGGHYHTKTNELFYIINGEITVKITDIQGKNKEEYLVKAGDIFIIKPYEVHTFVCHEDSSWINMLSQKFDNNNPDISRP